MSWTSDTQQVGSAGAVVVYLLLIAAAVAFKPNVEIPRTKLTMQAYWPVVALEATLLGFSLGFVLHLTPCLGGGCHEDGTTASEISAYMLIIAWPVAAAAILVARAVGFEQFSAFHIDRTASATKTGIATEEDTAIAVGARLFGGQFTPVNMAPFIPATA